MPELIEKGFQPWIQQQAGIKVLDLCCGGGCIGIATAIGHGEGNTIGANIGTSETGLRHGK